MTGAIIMAALLVLAAVVVLAARHRRKTPANSYGAGRYGDGDA